MLEFRQVGHRAGGAPLGLCLLLFVAGAVPAVASPESRAWADRSLQASVRDALEAKAGLWRDDGDGDLGRRRLAGEGAPDSLHAIVVMCDFSDSLMYGRWTEDSGFPPPTQTEFFYAAHDSLYFDHFFGDVRQYFRDVSDGAFTLDYTVHERTVNLPHPMGHYGNHPEEGEQPIRMAADVIDSLDAEIDFSSYDTVILIHAGAGEETDILNNSPEQIFSTYLGPDDFVRAQEDSILTTPYIPTSTHPEGTGVTHVLVLPETEYQDSLSGFGGFFGSLGVYCFEVGLRLGMLSLSDFTPGGRPDSQGIGEFGLMGYGLFVGAGFIPPHPCAFNKLLMGWCDPYLVDPAAGGRHYLTPAEHSSDPLAYARVPISGQEYWLLAYRLQDANGDSVFSWDNDLNGDGVPNFTNLADSTLVPFPGYDFFDPDLHVRETLVGAEWDFFMSENNARPPGVKAAGTGVYIWHVDEGVVQAAFGLQRNLFNADPARKSVDLEEADGIQDLDTREGSPYLLGGDDDSYRGEGTAHFGFATRPDTRSAGGAYTGIVIDQIGNVVVDAAHEFPDFPVNRVGVLYADSVAFVCRLESSAAGAPTRAAELTLANVDLAGSHLLAVDLDAAARPREIIAAGRSGEVFALTGSLLEYVDHDGDPATVVPLAIGLDPSGSPVAWNLPPAVGDIDGDGAPEIVLSGPDGLYGFKRDGGEVAAGGGSSFGLIAALDSVRLAPVLLPLTASEFGPDVATAACVIQQQDSGAVMHFLAGDGSALRPALPLGEVVVTAPPSRHRQQLDSSALFLCATDTAAGSHELIVVSWDPAGADPAVLARRSLDTAPSSFPVLAYGASARIVAEDGHVTMFRVDAEDYSSVGEASPWPESVTAFAPLSPAGGLAGDQVFGRITAEGVWYTGWPRRQQAAEDASAAALATLPLETAVGNASMALFASADGRLYRYDGRGNLQQGWPLVGPAASVGTPLLLDLDGDESLDLVAAGAFGRIVGISDDQEELVTEPLSEFVVWSDLGATETSSAVAMWGGSPWRDGWRTVTEDDGPPAQEQSLLVADSYICYPSPLTVPELIVRATVSTSSAVSVSIYNLEGEVVASSERTEVDRGLFELKIDLGQAASGLYLCRLTAEANGRSREDSVQPIAVVR